MFLVTVYMELALSETVHKATVAWYRYETRQIDKSDLKD